MEQNLKDKIEKIISHSGADENEIMFRLKQLIYETEMRNNGIKESKKISDLVSSTLSQLNNNDVNDIIWSGYADFDKSFGGFGRSEFVVIGGRPSMGKTQLLVNLSLNISKSVPVLYFTFDLSERLLTNRFIASVTGIPAQKILQNKLTDAERDKFLSAEKTLDDHQIFINESCGNSLLAFRELCKKQVEENGVRVIMVDYLQRMSSSRYRNNRELEISYICRELKNIANDFNICVIATSQLSRAVESRLTKRPMLSDLRESGSIEQDADKVIFIYRPEYYGIDFYETGDETAHVAELILSKNRHGELGMIKLLRDIHFTSFQSFENYQSDFTFNPNRLKELKIIDTQNKSKLDTYGLEEFNADILF